MNSNTDISFLPPEEGKCVSVVGDTYRILISGKETGGQYAVIDMMIPPGGGPGPHSHKDVQEMFYVVAGEVEFRKEGGQFVATAGAFINIPLGGAVHSFKNESEEVAHMVCTVVPAGSEEMFLEIGQPVERGAFLPPPEMNAETMAHFKAVAEKYGQRLYPPDYLD